MHHDEGDLSLLKDISLNSEVQSNQSKQGPKSTDIAYFKKPDTFMDCVEYHRERLNYGTDDW